ncbi:MAG: energy transducer TonB [Ferrovibrio sp.]|uniref:energy transducer TonB family protein n=1 Tax=Ferrovibrio sp. TaxID=1917215 RepID=UPI00391D3240
MPAPQSWAVAGLVHGGIAALLLAGSMSAPQPQPDSLPVFEIVLPAATAQPAPQPAPAMIEAAPEPAAAMPESEPEPEPLAEPEPQAEAPLPVAKPVSRPQRQPMPRPPQTPVADSAPAETTAIAAAAPSHQSSADQPALAQQTLAQQAMPPYAPILLDWLGRHRDYPRAARLRRQEGMPRIGITLDTSGRILALTLVESSGFALLDEAALDMARRAAPFPPPQLPRGTDRATFIVPVLFALQR